MVFVGVIICSCFVIQLYWLGRESRGYQHNEWSQLLCSVCMWLIVPFRCQFCFVCWIPIHSYWVIVQLSCSGISCCVNMGFSLELSLLLLMWFITALYMLGIMMGFVFVQSFHRCNWTDIQKCGNIHPSIDGNIIPCPCNDYTMLRHIRNCYRYYY